MAPSKAIEGSRGAVGALEGQYRALAEFSNVEGSSRAVQVELRSLNEL